jgi:hypothetical protein
MPPTISEIIASESWKHALFTTYTLSLSYFESEVLRPLIRSGCNDIWVIADAEGYRASLLERRAARVGQEYRLIPAALPHGIFHAKCIYLSGDDDLLLIGSGNVTFHGHGRNAEVFEVIRPEGAATAFRDFAEFLDLITAREDEIRLPRSEWAEEFAERARAAAARGMDPAGGRVVRLVHSLTDPIADQLRVLLAPYGACTDALIMSPYHDANGSAVAELLELINARRASVMAAGDESPFPFACAAGWDRPVSPVRLAQPERRFIHAKWYEFAMEQGRVQLTGSINATRKALLTTDNVEAGILRPLAQESGGLEYVPTPVPSFSSQKPLPSGLGTNELVYAAFDRARADRLYGQIITLRAPTGVWRIRLVQADGESLVYEVEVAVDGRFSVHAETLEAFSHMPSQIVMTLDEREARGWIHNEMLLGMGGHRRLTAGALARLMRRAETDEDIQALLDYFSIHAEEHLRLFNFPVIAHSVEGEGATEKEKTVTVHIDELAPIAAPSPPGYHPTNAVSDDNQFHAAMARLRRVLLGHGRERAKAAESGRSTAVAEQGEPEVPSGNTPEQMAETLGLSNFENEIRKRIEEAAVDRPPLRDALLVVLLEVSMAMRLYRLDDKDGAHEFLTIWLADACRLSSVRRETQTALQQHVVTASAILYTLGSAAGEKACIAMELHDSLERFYRGPADREHALRALITDTHTGFADALLGDLGNVNLSGALDAILEKRTRRQQLDDALTRAAKGQPVPADW